MPLFQNKNPDKDLRQQREQITKRTVSSFKKLLNWPKSTALRFFLSLKIEIYPNTGSTKDFHTK